MKQAILITFLFFYVSLGCNTTIVCCEETQEELYERYFGDLNIIHTGDSPARSYSLLMAHGDYAKLKLIIRSTKKNYYPGVPIEIVFFARNDSDGEIHLEDFTVLFFLNLWKLFHSNYDEVTKTLHWENETQKYKDTMRPPRYEFIGKERGDEGKYLRLQPGQEYEFDLRVRLSDYFDLSQPDTYELTCFLPTVIGGQYYKPPLQSNTLTFRVLEDGEKASDIGTDMNPSKGEEVFKQPKPPKYVFYYADKEFTDISATEYTFKRAREKIDALRFQAESLMK